MSIRERIKTLIAEAETGGEEQYAGDDWCQLSDAEAEVFEIPPAEFPRLLVAWQVYQAFCGIIGPEDAGLEPEQIAAERARRPEFFEQAVVSEEGFRVLSKEWCEVPNRQAHAMYAKIDFWNVRNSGVSYGDE